MKDIKTIRTEVTTIANRLKKTGLSLSEAFKKAWKIVKNGTLETKVSGVTVGNRQRALQKIHDKYSIEDVAVSLERDMLNGHDNNAVKVNISVKGSQLYELGYIPKNIAYIIASVIDKGVNLKATFKEIRGKYSDYMNYGAVISLEI